jgi:hypothetical protein
MKAAKKASSTTSVVAKAALLAIHSQKKLQRSTQITQVYYLI